MKNRQYGSYALLLSWGMVLAGCYAPQYIFRQRDIQPYEMNMPTQPKKILVASRSTEFKDAVVERIKGSFQGKRVYLKFIGIENLKDENGGDYDAVVILNTCMNWTMDRHVEAFLKRHPYQGNMIILTTSGDGDWLPSMKERTFDAVSSASKIDRVDEIAKRILERVQQLLLVG